MKIFKAISSGFQRTARATKQIILIWFISILLTSLLVIPLRNTLLGFAGSTMSTELLNNGFDISYWVGQGSKLAPVLASFSIGLIAFIGISLLMYVFLSGGLFHSIKENSCGYKISDFFSSSARNFFPFLWVNLMVIAMILVAIFIFIGIPIIIIRSGEAGETSLLSAVKILRIIFLLVVMIFLLVSDYARAWLTTSGNRNPFKAVGYGFKATFTSFVSSYLFMILAAGLQLVFTWLAGKLLFSMEPQEGGGLFLLFLASQLMIIIRLYLKTFRYAGVTSLYTLG